MSNDSYQMYKITTGTDSLRCSPRHGVQTHKDRLEIEGVHQLRYTPGDYHQMEIKVRLLEVGTKEVILCWYRIIYHKNMAAVDGVIGSESFVTKSDRNFSDGSKNIDDNKNYCNECNNGENSVDLTLNETHKMSDVQEFYNGRNILITGATGFLGKILMEKLLRCCPGVENIYILIRQKRGKDINTRIEEMFEDPVFDRLKEEVPKFRHKIVAIPADCEAAGLGLTISDRQTIIEKVLIDNNRDQLLNVLSEARCGYP